MIEGNETPFIGYMALITGLIKITLMEVLMTVRTCRINGFEVSIFMTCIAGYREVLSSQFKAASTVVKEGDGPRIRTFVTVTTICILELISMNRRRVAKGTFWLSIIFELRSIRMTTVTRLILMTPLQSKAGDRMIEVSLKPAFWTMALRASCISKGLSVRVFVLMTFFAFLRSRFIKSVGMTFGAIDSSVFTYKWKLALSIVVEDQFREALLTMTILAK